MKQIILLTSLMISTVLAYAQQPGGRSERIHTIKVGYLTDKLNLSTAQAAAFWPVYDNYEAELRGIRRAFRQKYRTQPGNESPARAEQYIEDNLDYQEQTLGVNRKYKDRFLKIISAQQLASLYEAEREFKKLLIRQLRERREPGGGESPRQRR